MKDSSRWRSPTLLPGAILALSGLVLVWTRLLPLTQSMWADEVVTITVYAHPGPGAIFGHYVANDHMLFELLAWATTGITGDHGTAAYRFWAVAPAIAAGALLAWWLWRRLDPWVAALFGALATASPLYFGLSVEARGYGLAFLAMSLVLIGADWFDERGGVWPLAVFVAGSLIGIWTLPVFVLPVIAMGGLLALRASPTRRRSVFWAARSSAWGRWRSTPQFSET
jgi:hypothetical protein